MADKSGFAFKHKFTLKDGQEVQVESGIVEVVRFERANQQPFMRGRDITMTALMWVGWAAAARRKLIKETGKFDMFLDREMEGWELEDDVDPADQPSEAGDPIAPSDTDPTQPDPQPERSSDSPS